jgi:UDP-N-acetylmuramate--alanine ligase
MVERLDLRRDGRRLLTYGVAEGADLQLLASRQDGFTTIFDAALSSRVAGGARKITDWRVPVPGHHNALNALAAIAVAAEAHIPDEIIRAGLAEFSGVKRRFQPTGQWNGIQIFDDYAHHPIEIAAVLQAARAGAKGRVIAVCEPHRYTRVRDLFGEFCSCFRDADSVIVAPLYSAGEAPISGIDQHTLAECIRNAGHRAVTSVDHPADIVPLLRRYGRPGDMVVCLGAGTSTEWAASLPQWLSAQAAE